MAIFKNQAKSTSRRRPPQGVLNILIVLNILNIVILLIVLPRVNPTNRFICNRPVATYSPAPTLPGTTWLSTITGV